MNRICIFVTYDKKGIIDEYIAYILKEIKTCTDKLVVVCNQENQPIGIEKIYKYADECFFRKNIGFDAGAFKDGLCKFIGVDEVIKYDELILINDSFFGPFIPFEQIFDEMKDDSSDFWGLISHACVNNEDVGDIPEHIQSFFLAIRSQMLKNKDFITYWKEMPYYNKFNDVVVNHEMTFTQKFKALGFSYSSYAMTSVNNSQNIKNNFAQYMNLSYELIKKRNFPFLKKQQLAYNTLNQQTQENYLKAINYIDKNTDYDVRLIWDNIIRTLDINDLYRNFHLRFLIPTIDYKKSLPNTLSNKYVICVCVLYMSAVDEVCEYLCPIREQNTYSVIICSDNKNLLEKYHALGFEIVIKEVAFKSLAEYEYVCIIHDFDLSSDVSPSYIGKALFYNVWNNMIGDYRYINQIIDLFDTNAQIGVLMPPAPNFGGSFGSQYESWGGQYENILSCLNLHEINCVISEDKIPFRISENVWVRGSILKKIAIMSELEQNLLPYIWIYLAQDQLLLSGIIESVEYASMDCINQTYYLAEMERQVAEQYGSFDTFLEFKKHIFSGAVYRFCNKYRKIYVYGIGFLAKQYKSVIPQIDGYVVSDGQSKPDLFDGKKIYYLSEIYVDDTVGIVLCLDKKNQMQVIPLLKRLKINNFICV